ncbi:hypothetical protein E2I00_000550, partial [Balaenoptera physalus]
VKEWLCLNCQMQRALGMDMTTAPRSKSQQQLHSPALSPVHSPAKQPLGKPEQERSRGPGGPQPGPHQAETARATSVPGPAQAAAPPEVGRMSPQPPLPIKPSTAEPRPPAGEALAKSATTAPSGPGAAEQTQEGLTGKLFGLGASLLTQASTLMSVQPEADPQGQPAPSKGPPKIVFSDASQQAGPRPPGSGPGSGPAPGAKTEPGAKTGPGSGPGALARTGGTTSPKHGKAEHQAVAKAAAKPKTMPKERATCPLCQAELNVGSKGPANYNTCTTCRLQVCNLCGFNPTPHLVEASPLPTKASPLPTKASPQAKPLRASEPIRTPSSAQEKKTGIPAKAEPVPKPPPATTLPPGTPKAKAGVRRTEPATPVKAGVPEAPKGREAEEPVGKPYSQDLSRSPQSLSDTGYSSDGVSSSQSEITGIVQQEVEQLDSAGATGPRPPSPSELHKVGSSMRPSLEAQGPAPSGERSKPPYGSGEEQKRRPHSLSIMPEAFNSDEELEDILEEEDSLEWGRRREQQDTAESSDDFGSQLRHDYVEDSSEGGLSPLPPQPPSRAAELTDEEFMRRQILEMSAEEDNLEEDDAAPAGHGPPELEMESLTGSPEDRSRGEHSSTLPASTPSYTSGTSPTSLSSLEEDSDSSPSRRQRLEEAKQQRKARHRSHGPLLPTIEDSSEEEELREEEELLREQEKMREVEQQRIRSTARKTRRDKEELRAQRRRERSKTPPSNLSPIEDASPTEELRQAAEMEELHRSSCSEYSPSPSLDSEAEALDGGPPRLYKSGSEYNLPTFITATPSSGRPLKSAEEAYEEMMRKAELLQRQQGQAAGSRGPHASLGAAVYQEILQTSQSIARMHQASSRDLAFAEDKKKEKQFLNAESASGGRVIPDVRVTQHFAKEPQDPLKLHSSPASPSSASKEVGLTFTQGPGTPASTAVAPCPAGLPRGYVTPTSPAGSESSPLPSSTGHSYGQSPTTANYGSQTEELPQPPRGPAVSGRAAREKPLSVSDGESGTLQTSRGYSYFAGSSPPLSPSSPSESPTFSPGKLGPKATAEFSTQTPSLTPASDMPRSPGAPTPTPTVAQGTQTPHRPSTPRLVWQQSSQDAPFMVITLASDASSQTKMVHASASTSPVCSPIDTQPTTHSYSQTTPQLPPEPPGPPGFPRAASAGADGPLALYGWGALPAENISLCRISSVPGTSRVEPGPRPTGSAVVDLRTAVKPTPIILTDQGMDLTSLAVEARKYGLALDPIPGRQSTAVQPLVINLNAQEQTHAFLSTATTVSITMASSVLMAQQKQPVVYGDPFQSRLDFGQGAGSPVCLAQVKQVEQAVQTAPYRGGPRGRPREAKFARYNLPNQVAPLARRDVLITQVGTAQSVGLKSGPVPEPGSEPHRATPAELRSHALPGARKPHTVVVQMGEGTAGTVTTLLPEEPAGALDLTGMRPESQLACCDMVYKFPFGSSCTGTFHPAPSAPEKSVADVAPPSQSSGPFYSPRDPEPPEAPTYRAQVVGGPGPHEEQRPYPQGLPGRLYSSMSDTNLAEAGLNYHTHRIGHLFQGPGRDSAMDLSSLKHSYSLGFADGRYLGQGLQYGSFTDLRHPTDLLTHPLPMRRYSSVSNIYSDHRPGLLGNPTFPEGHPSPGNLAQYRPTAAQGTAIRQLLPSTATVRAADGMIYSTINTPIAATLPITTQPASALRPMVRGGMYRPYASGGVTAPAAAKAPGAGGPPRPELPAAAAREEPLSTATPAAVKEAEELERERVELQRHREEEQLLVQRELQELQTIKHHVLQQQQEERQAQFALQREQLAQQRLQLEQIQQLQQQLQQQLEEQKQRQKAPFPVACEAPGRGPPPAATELAQNGQYWPPLTHAAFIAVPGPEGPGQPREPVLHRGLPSSASDMSLQTEEQWEAGRSGIKKRHSMPRLRDVCEPESGPEPCVVRRIADSSMQTDDEDGEGRYLLTRRRRARRSADCSTISDCSVQTEPDQLPRVSPAIHITAATDPKVEIAHLPPESLSQLLSRQPPKSPQVLYSPVSPLSPHRLLDTSFASSERLNKAHVSPQKHFTADSALRQQTLPRPMKTLQRSLSDPKPLSPTAEESAKERFSLYQHQGVLGSQVSALPPNGLVRKVKRTLPSPPPEEAHLPLAGQAPPQLYAASLLQRGLVGPTAVPATKASLLRELDRDLRLVEHESTKLRKKQAELDEEEKEIDAKLKYLELGITQRKESLARDRGGRDYPPLRGLSEHRDYLSDTTPYAAGSGGPTQNGFPAHQAPTYPGPSTYPAPAFPPGASYSAEPGLPSQQAFRPTGHYTAQTPMPTTQSTLYPVPTDSRTPHQKPRQTSLADLEQKVPTNYEVIASPVVTMSSASSETSYSGPAVSSSYEQGKAPELPRASDRSGVSLSPAPTYPSDSHYTSLEQNVPRNYVMIDDISELTKESASTAPDSQGLEPLGPSSSGRPGKEPGEPGVLEGPTLPCCYTRGEEESEEDSYDPRGKSGHHRSVESNGRLASTHYYSDSDYRHGARAEKYSPGPVGPKHPSKSLAPAAVSSKRSKHRKQGMEQKISKFSPIEEAKDVESDLASYPSPAVSSSLASRGRKFQDEITYGLKKNVYEQQRYYGVSSRDPVEEDDRMYSGSSRSRVASAYSGEKLSSHDFSGRAKGYEREREAFCSSHSMPDVQEHVKDGPRAHAYKCEEGYILDDSHCVVSDSEAYHLGQEETDWFDKPRDARSDRFRHHGGHAVSSSSQKRGPARHGYHDYDEPPEEGLWPHDEGGLGRHASAKEHRHHGDHGRHSGRHTGEEPGRRAAKPHVRDLSRHEARPHPQPSPAPTVQKKGQPGYPSSGEYSQPSRVPSAYHHASESKKGSRQAHSGPAALQPKPELQLQPQASQQGSLSQGPQQPQAPSHQDHRGQSRRTALKGLPKHPSRGDFLRPSHHQDLDLQGTCEISSQLLSHSDPEEPGQAQLMMVVSLPLGMKAGAKPGGTPGAPAGQPGADGESVLSKILPGGAAEQAGKLTE